MSKFSELSLVNKFWAAFLILGACLFVFAAVITRNQPGVAIFAIGFAAQFISAACNPVALVTPRETFNRELMPKPAKILHTIAATCMSSGMILHFVDCR